MPVIQVKNLTKTFKRQKRKSGFWGSVQSLFKREYEVIRAVDEVSFEVDRGEIIGYIGPNGAGKSTTIKMLVGILYPTSGEVEINGRAPFKNRVENAKRMGVVFGQRSQLFWDIPVSESLNLTRYMYKIPKDQYQANLKLLSEIFGLNDFINIPVRQLSLGQRMRADLCMALMHDPEILYLDEPTIGLDVVIKEDIREFIRKINQEKGTTVVLTTHDVSDVEKLCKRVLVIDHGKIIYDGELAELKNRYGAEETMEVELDNEFQDDVLKGVDILDLQNEGNKLQIRYDRTRANSSKILSWLMKKYEVKDFVVKEADIETVIRTMYQQMEHKQDIP